MRRVVVVAIRLSVEEKGALERAAAAQGLSLSALVQRFVRALAGSAASSVENAAGAADEAVAHSERNLEEARFRVEQMRRPKPDASTVDEM